MKFFDPAYTKRALNGGGFLELNNDYVQVLELLHLSRDEIELYDLLLHEKKAMTAQDVASKVAVFPSATYRCFYTLESFGLVAQVARRPKSYTAKPPEVSLTLAAESAHAQVLKQLEDLNISTNTSAEKVEILIGGKALYDRYVLELSKTKTYIDGHSMGNAYSEDMLREHRLAEKRGVVIRYAFQEFSHKTAPILKQWERVGIRLRHYKIERGFHFIVFDDDRLLLSFVNPENTDDRISLFTRNRVAIAVFRGYFETIWRQARAVSLFDDSPQA